MDPTLVTFCPKHPYLYAVNITACYYEIHSNVILSSTAALFTLLKKPHCTSYQRLYKAHVIMFCNFKLNFYCCTKYFLR